MFVLGRPGRAAARGGREGAFLTSLPPSPCSPLGSCCPLPIALRPLAVCRAAALREASHSSPSDPLFLFLRSLEEYEALGIIRLFQVSLEKEVNRLGEYKESPFL